MTTRPETLKQSELLNQLVLDRTTMEELGRVEVLWMYPEAHRVLGFVCKTGLLGNRKLAFKLAQIDAFGPNGILTHSQPEETDAERVRQLESLIQTDVWTDSGERVGKVIDCIFKLQTGYITDYLLVTDGLVGITSNVYRLPPSKILSLGRKRVLVSDSVAQNLLIYRESVRQKLTKTGEFLKDDVTQELKSLVEQAQSVTQQARDRWFSLTEQFKEQAQHLSQQTKETLQTINQQVQERTQDWTEHSGEDELPRSTSPWRLQALKSAEDENFTTVPVQAEEIPDILEERLEEPQFSNIPEAVEDFSTDLPSESETLAQPEEDLVNQWEDWDVDDDEFWLDVVPPEARQSPQPAVTNLGQPELEQQVLTPETPQPVPQSATSDEDDDDEPWI